MALSKQCVISYRSIVKSMLELCLDMPNPRKILSCQNSYNLVLQFVLFLNVTLLIDSCKFNFLPCPDKLNLKLHFFLRHKKIKMVYSYVSEEFRTVIDHRKKYFISFAHKMYFHKYLLLY